MKQCNPKERHAVLKNKPTLLYAAQKGVCQKISFKSYWKRHADGVKLNHILTN